MREILFPEHSRRTSWIELFSFSECETGEQIRLLRTDGTPFLDMVATIHPTNPVHGGDWYGQGLGPYYDRPLPGPFSHACDAIQATTANGGVTVVDVGVLCVRFGLDQMRFLHPGSYRFSFTLGDGQDGIELIRGTLPIVTY